MLTTVFVALKWIILVFGAAIVGVNCYFSFIRPVLDSRIGQQGKYISPIPLLGSVLAAVGLVLIFPLSFLVIVAAMLIVLLDSGGPFWVIVSWLGRHHP